MTRLVLVVGCPRSGTTWLGQMLMAHPDASGLPEGESNLFLCLQDVLASPRRTDGGGVSGYLDVESVDRAARRFCDQMLQSAVAASNAAATVFVEKTPAHAFMLRRIQRLYPDVAVVHVVRDGRDVSRSLHELSFGAPDVATAAWAWRRTLEAVRRQSSAMTHLLEVRYEDLLADPVGHVSELFRWLGLPADDAAAERVRRVADRRVSKFDTTGPVGAGKWRSLSRRQIAQVYAAAGSLLIEHGYADRAEVRRVLRAPWGLVAQVECGVRSRSRGRRGADP